MSSYGFDNNLSNLPPGVTDRMIDGDGFFCSVCEDKITEEESDEQEGMCSYHYQQSLDALADEQDYDDEKEDF
jgi:hypothetical protein